MSTYHESSVMDATTPSPLPEWLAFEQGYNRYSRLPNVTVLRPFDEYRDGGLAFIQFARALEFRNNVGSHSSSTGLFYDLGAVIANAENDYLVKRVHGVLTEPTSVVKRPDEKTIQSTIHQMCDELVRKEYRPSVLFAPVEFMKPMMAAIPFRAGDGCDSILTASGFLDVFWSNSDVNFTDFIVMDGKRFSEWVFRPKSGRRLSFELTPFSLQPYRAIVKTTIAYNILESKAAIRVEVA